MDVIVLDLIEFLAAIANRSEEKKKKLDLYICEKYCTDQKLVCWNYFP